MHYELNPDWFKTNATRLRNEKTMASKKLGSNGGKRKWTPAVAEQARELNRKYNRRASNKTIAAGLGLSRRTVDKNLKAEKYVYRRIAPKPKLTPENIVTRNNFARAVLSGKARTRHQAWVDCVDIDEKNFKLPGFTDTLRFHPDSDVDSDDEDLHPSCQSKRFIPGIMITSAVTRAT